MDCIHVVIVAVIRANVDFLVLEPQFNPYPANVEKMVSS